ncbi:primary-amine oxidase [Paenarthrobacter ureafaciens]|uniref:primary-amine oxidase n=1 Tax=Paenarthrobacter ureafaciens TaxID=37931 RepID=UPI001C2C3793|nr:primary-amine oxidase [Paenarthrobacter ureafaciens]
MIRYASGETPVSGRDVQVLHPLDPLTVEEIRVFKDVLVDAGLAGERTAFTYVGIREPAKEEVLAYNDGDEIPRIVSALLFEAGGHQPRTVLVDVSNKIVLKHQEMDPSIEGQGPILKSEYELAERLVKSDSAWLDAMARRGLHDLDTVKTVPLSAGVFGYDDEVGNRVLRVLAFEQKYPTDSMWAHPIDGVVAHIDTTNERVLRVIDTGHTNVPQESGDYNDEAVRGPFRTTLKPIHITQPEGVSFQLKGQQLTWENWSLRVGFNGREGLTLHQVGFEDGGSVRPIIYRASISEMAVPYGDPSPTHAWQNYFDVGEYQFGRLANSLKLGCDCLGEITYMDATIVDDFGEPKVIEQAICIHEEDYGVLWKHTDSFAGTSEVRRQRRLVISFFVTVGNYDYGFYWYLYLDGTIELEAKATGIVFTSGHPGGDYPYASEIAPGLGAPYHQHLFSARLDMMVDGVANAVDEVEVQRVPLGEGNPWGNALAKKTTRLRTEAEGARDAAMDKGRVWHVLSTERNNRLGHPTSYVLYPEGQPTLASVPQASATARANFATKTLWVTQYHRDELWAAGEVVNQHPGGAGLPTYISADREIDGKDIVLWHTFGLTHYPRPEDWPIMPVDYAGFKLKPHGFFDRNPTLNVPKLTEQCTTTPHNGENTCH